MAKRKTRSGMTLSDRAALAADRASTLWEDAFPSYVESVLIPGETIVTRSRLHWIVFAPAIGLFCAAAFLRIAIGAVEPSATVAGWIGLIVAAMGAVSLLGTAVTRASTEIAVTTKRVIHKRGLVWRKSMEMNVEKVESVDVDQSILGRMLGYGTITIKGTGSASEPLTGIEDPLRFRSAITAR